LLHSFTRPGEGATEVRLPRRKVTARPQVDPDLEGEFGAELDDLLGDEPE
jgi:hypothetical protein